MKPFSLEEYLAKPSKKVITRGGSTVKIHCTNYRDEKPIIAEIEGSGESLSYHKDGRYFPDTESVRDLFFATEKREGWVNIYKGGNRDYFTLGALIYDQKEDAERCRIEETCVATVKIEWEDE